MIKLNEDVVKQSVLMFMGSRELYELPLTHKDFDSIFASSGVKSRLVVKAVRSRMDGLGLTFDGFVEHVEVLFHELAGKYPFMERGEELRIDELDGFDAVSLRVPHFSWRYPEPNGTPENPAAVILFTINSLLECDGRANFFTELLGNIFDVPLNIRDHLMHVSPNLQGFPRVFLETWLFLQYVEHDWALHDNSECASIVEKFNKTVYHAFNNSNDESIDDLSKETFFNKINRVYVGTTNYGTYSERTRGGFIRVNHNMLKIGTTSNSRTVIKYFTGNLNIINIESALLCLLFLNSSCFPTRKNIDLTLATDAMFMLMSNNEKYSMDAQEYTLHAGRVISHDFKDFFLTCVSDLTEAFELEKQLGAAGLTSSEKYNTIKINNFDKMVKRFTSSLNLEQLDLVDDLPEEWVRRI